MNESANQIPILAKAIQVLEDLAGAPEASSAAALSRRLDIAGASCYRILQTFIAHHWVRPQGRGGHALGVGLLPIARALSAADPLAPYYPVLDAFAAQHGWTCKISIRRGDQAVTVFRAEGSRTYALAVRLGSAFPIVYGSSGAALLVDLTAAELDALVAAAPAESWRRQSPDDLRARVAEAARGIACDRGSYRPDIISCSLPLRGADGQVEASATAISLAADAAEGELDAVAAAFAAAIHAVAPERAP